MKYPNNIIKSNQKNINYSNRGMSLEFDLNITNDYYRDKNIAVIYKKPTPIRVVNVDFTNIKKPIINKAFFEKASTTDYNGIYKGKYVDFEAKEVKSKKSFCLSNIHKHQLEHLFKVKEHKGISFIIVRFIKFNKTFLLDSEILLKFINKGNKSISIDLFNEYGYQVNEGYRPRVDYIKVIDHIYFGG